MTQFWAIRWLAMVSFFAFATLAMSTLMPLTF